MAQSLQNLLQHHGCHVDPREFRRVLATAKQELYPGMSEERLVCTDEENDRYCDEVCRRLGTPLPRPFIRFQLLNNHK